MMGGLLDSITEAAAIAEQLDVPFDQALEFWKQIQQERIQEYERAVAQSNVIPFRAKH
jgi:hypothetical protein